MFHKTAFTKVVSYNFGARTADLHNCTGGAEKRSSECNRGFTAGPEQAKATTAARNVTRRASSCNNA